MSIRRALLENLRIVVARIFFKQVELRIEEIILISEVSELIHYCVVLEVSEEDMFVSICRGREFAKSKLSNNEEGKAVQGGCYEYPES